MDCHTLRLCGLAAPRRAAASQGPRRGSKPYYGLLKPRRAADFPRPCLRRPPRLGREQSILWFLWVAMARRAAGPRGQTILWFGGARRGAAAAFLRGGHGLRGAGACAGAYKNARLRAYADADAEDDGARRCAHAAGGRPDRAATGAPGVPGRAAAPPGQRGAVRGGAGPSRREPAGARLLRLRAGLREQTIIIAAAYAWLGGATAPPRVQTIVWFVWRATAPRADHSMVCSSRGARPRPLAGRGLRP